MLKTPPLQTATATIDTLCGRLQSATLLEDRRAAILGLRSFAKQYPASVASGSLRELIATLRRDGLGEANSSAANGSGLQQVQEGGDIDTIRLILETFLALFNPDSSSPEAGEEIAFFLADEFSTRQDNIILLLSLLDPTSPYADYYSRLYSVQLLSAVCAARPERLQECVLTAPLGVSRLVGVLDDARDQVRNAGLLLLVDLTSGANEDLRKIVAFEDVFAKLFALIQLEGGIAEAGITGQDCLSLLANLITNSASNQTMFRESGCVTHLTRLLQQAFPPNEPEASFIAQSREKAAWGMLQLLRLFLTTSEASSVQNQSAFFRSGTAQILIDLGFSPSLPAPIKSSALKCAAALIEANPSLQEQFAALTVITPSDAEANSQRLSGLLPTNGTGQGAGSVKTSARASIEKKRSYIIEALLDLTLNGTSADYETRAAGRRLIQGYLTKHDRIRSHFLQRAIAGHAERESAANVLATLLQPSEVDPDRTIFASTIVQDLIFESADAKSALAAVQEGNESEGEDVLSFLQAIGALLQAALQQRTVETRVAAAYAGVLTVFLWDFAPGVDDLLSEGSSLVQALLSTAKSPTTEPVATGISAALLGTIYEFSTKDSPITRRSLMPLLLQNLGRSKYLDALLQFRREPAIRDFGLDSDLDESPDDVFGRTYVDLFTVEYSRLRRAIDKDPGVEVLPPSAAAAGVDRDILDELRQQNETLKSETALAQRQALESSQKSEQDRLAASKDLQIANAELDRLRRINQAMQQGHESEMEKTTTKHKAEQEASTKQHSQEREKLAKQQSQEREKLTKQHVEERANYVKQQEQERENLAKQLKEEREKLTKQLEQQKQASQSQQSRAIADARQEVERQTQATLREREATFAQKTQDYERRLAELGNAHRLEANGHNSVKQQLEALTSKHNAVTSRGQELNKQVDDLQSQLDKLQREHEILKARASKADTELSETQDSLDTRSAEVNKLSTQFSELQEEIKSREEELKTERAGFADLEKELEAAKRASAELEAKAANDRIPELEAALIEAKENEVSAKEELESMLLVMGDIESKRDGYKAKIKELGGEVTDEDGEDDDDEGEEEEEEEENDDDVD